MKIRGMLIFCILAILIGLNGHAIETKSTASRLHNNNFYFKQISYEQGLPGINLRDQIQDSKGIIWLAIESIGVSRYDGHKFTLFRNDPNNANSLSNNYVNRIIEDSEGNLWFATDYGLNRYNREDNQFQHFLTEENNTESLPSNVCTSLYVDSKQNLWIGTENGLARWDNNSKSFKRYFSQNDTLNWIGQLSVLSIFEQKNGILWLGTNSGLIKFDPITEQYKKWEKIGTGTNEPIHNRILSICEDRNGYLWIGTHRGMDRFDLEKEKFVRWKFSPNDQSDLEQEGINAIMIDKLGMMWIGTYTKGLLIINTSTGEYRRITKESGSDYPLRSNHIRYIYEDALGLIWIGTKFEGLFLYDENINEFNSWPERFEAFVPLKNKYIYTFFEDSPTVFWLGSKLEGLFKIDIAKNKITNYQHDKNKSNTLSSNRIQAILRDNENNLWIGTEAGLNLYNEKGEIFHSYGDIPITSLNQDSTGTIWVGTTTGIYTIDKDNKALKRISKPFFPEFFRNDNIEITNISIDRTGTIWFCSRYNGLFHYNPATSEYGTFTKANSGDKGFTDNMPRSVIEDTYGKIWIGTKAGGLFLFDRPTKTFSQYTTENGMPSNMVLSLVEDKDHNIWLGTHNGISKFDQKTSTFTNYNSDYGLLSNIVEQGAYHAFKSGEILFGGNNGFNIFHPDNIQRNDFVPPMVISSVKIYDEEIARDISSTKTISLSNNQNYISFEFALTDYKNPYRHQYAVQMTGIDQEWKQIGERNYISYTNLSPGEYTFSVKGANELGIWTKEPLSIKLIISPPFYKTLIFRIGIILLLVLVSAFVYKQSKQRNALLEKMIKERTRKLENAYEELLEKNKMINEQKKEIELHHSQLEQKVRERTRDLEYAKRKAEESDRLKSSFLANMSHEIRTPLNAITGFSSLIANEMYGAEKRTKYVNIIKANADSLLKLVEDILDISKIEAGQLTINKSTFDFGMMMSEIYTVFQEELRAKNKPYIDFIYSKPVEQESNFTFYSDPQRLRQIMVNLLSNAIKFTHRGSIEFGYTFKSFSILLYVKDTGIGIQQKDLETIFDRFIKIEEDTAVYRGTGLGLSITRSLAELLGGRVWVESTLNEGSCFHVEIPGEITFLNSETSVQSINKTDKLNLHDKSILIVEDEKSNFELLSSFLHQTGAKVSWAPDGLMAEEMCRQNRYDLILLDIRMPEIDGFETIKRIRTIHPMIPVIAQTAFAAADDKRKIAESGFNDLLTKPFTREELYLRISKLI
jgi:signal transduction histidine kinase/ligand-binding sensor domain-containing protein/CheY-like chemotaxis protein